MRHKPSYFYLNVDGLEKADAIKRAFWFKTDVPLGRKSTTGDRG